MEKIFWKVWKFVNRIDERNWRQPLSARQYVAQKLAVRLLAGSRGWTLRNPDSDIVIRVD